MRDPGLLPGEPGDPAGCPDGSSGRDQRRVYGPLFQRRGIFRRRDPRGNAYRSDGRRHRTGGYGFQYRGAGHGEPAVRYRAFLPQPGQEKLCGDQPDDQRYL